MAIRELIKNKKYKIELDMGFNGSKRIRHYEIVYGGKKDAELRVAQLKIDKKNNTYIDKSKITVSQLLTDWLEYSKSNWSPKTYNSNVNWVKIINKVIGHVTLQSLNVKILENFYKHLNENTTLAAMSKRHIYTTLSTALNKAILWGYISCNHNARIEKPKAAKKEIDCYSPDEAAALMNALNQECLKYRALITLALDSGARRSEITGLTWDDIDFDTRNITINKTTQYTKSTGIFEKSTKNKTSNRTFTLTSTTIRVLRQYRKEQLELKLRLGSHWQGSKRIFTTDYGADMHPDTPSKILDKIIKKHNLKRITFHGLRHTSISLQIAKGVQPQIISKRAGHSNVTVTHAIYSHFFANEFENVAEVLDDFLKAQ